MVRMIAKLSLLLTLISLVAARQIPPQTETSKFFEVERINVSGTRIPGNSLVALSGIKLHDKVNELIVNTACHKITATGLFKTIDYSYDAYPDRNGVVLNLILADEGPLLPASIKPEADENAIWTSLQTMDSIFTRQLPPTEKAIAF